MCPRMNPLWKQGLCTGRDEVMVVGSGSPAQRALGLIGKESVDTAVQTEAAEGSVKVSRGMSTPTAWWPVRHQTPGKGQGWLSCRAPKRSQPLAPEPPGRGTTKRATSAAVAAAPPPRSRSSVQPAGGKDCREWCWLVVFFSPFN